MIKRNVLFIVYEFPPEGARGTKRAMKFIKYLRSLGWNPIILTVKSPNYDFHDGSLISELPSSLLIFRATTLESIFFKKRYKSNEISDARSDKVKMSGFSLTRKLLVNVYLFAGKVMGVVDSRILWLPFAFKKGLRIIRKEKIEVMFASGPSFTNHLVGMLLKKFSGKPLIVDFRDAWAADPARKLEKKWKRNLLNKLERQVVITANKVISTTDGIKSDFVKRYGDVNNKFVTITNGFDPADFRDFKYPSKIGRSLPFKIVHVGTLGWERSPKEFLEALGDLIKEEPELGTNIQLLLVGQNNPFRDGKTVENYIKEYKLENVVKLTGFISRRESLRYIVGAHLLLVIIGKVPKEGRYVYGISAKIYDYAAAGKPVMTVSEEGASADMARHLALGCVVHPDDKDMIMKMIRNYYSAFATDTLEVKPNTDALQAFDFRNLTKRLAGCFSDISG